MSTTTCGSDSSPNGGSESACRIGANLVRELSAADRGLELATWGRYGPARRTRRPWADPRHDRPRGARGTTGRRVRSASTSASTRPPTRCTSATSSASCSCAASSSPATARSRSPAARRHGRRSRRPQRGAQPARPRHAAPQRRVHQGAADASCSTSSPARTRRRWSTTPTGPTPITLLEFLRDVGKYFTVNQMMAKDSVRVAARERARHLVHRVQLHAAAGQRLPPPVRAPRRRAAGRRLRPVGQHRRRRRPDPPPARRSRRSR